MYTACFLGMHCTTVFDSTVTGCGGNAIIKPDSHIIMLLCYIVTRSCIMLSTCSNTHICLHFVVSRSAND